ncbi:MAG: response regulator [Spirochaetota bacterium]|nr:response regulator [Spirochaetota bacterium]
MPQTPKQYVLIVEDEDAIRLTLRDYLQGKGVSVLVASDGVGAIKHLLDYDVKVIISDYRMEIFGGEYWIKFMDKYCRDTHIIITSGFLRPEFTIPFEVIYKPFDFQDLAEKVKKLLIEKP